MEQQASLHLCNLLARGKTMEEAKEILAPRDSSLSPVVTVGTEQAPAETGATGGGEPPAAPVTPVDTPAATGEAKPVWMP